MARRVRPQAITAEDAADGKVSEFHLRACWIPAMAAAAPTTPAISAKITKKPVAWLPIGK